MLAHATPAPVPALDAGTSSTACELVLVGDGVTWVVLFAAEPMRKRSGRRAASIVERTVRAIVDTADVGVGRTLQALAVECDLALRRVFAPLDPDGTGTFVVAAVEGDRVRVGSTRGGAAYLFRSDRPPQVLEASESEPAPPFLGGRPSDAGDIRVPIIETRLGPQTRLVLSSRRLFPRMNLQKLADVVAAGTPEVVASAVAGMTSARTGAECAVAVLESCVADAEESGDFDGLLAGLEDVLLDFEEPPAPVIAAVPLPADTPTESFTPIRLATPPAELELGDASSPLVDGAAGAPLTLSPGPPARLPAPAQSPPTWPWLLALLVGGVLLALLI